MVKIWESYCAFLHFNDIPKTRIDEYFCLQNLFSSRLIFLLLKIFKIWSTKRANMGLAEEFRAKVEGSSSKNFLGALPPDPLSHCPPLICHIYVLISKISGVAQGLVYLEFIGNGNSIGPHPDHSHLYCHTQMYLVSKSFGRKMSTVCTSHTLQTGKRRYEITTFDTFSTSNFVPFQAQRRRNGGTHVSGSWSVVR